MIPKSSPRQTIPMFWRNPVGPCSFCGKESLLILSEDRFFHLDGSENETCWVGILRGNKRTVPVLMFDAKGFPYLAYADGPDLIRYEAST